MECVVRKNSEITLEKAEELFQIFINNMSKYADMNSFFKGIKTEQYKDKWINDVLNNDKLSSYEYYENDNLVGYILIIFLDNENYIHEFEIDSKYQGDGKTFKEMVKNTIDLIDNNNDFSGDIWFINKKSRNVFKHIGASFVDDKYIASRDVLLRWIEM